MNTATERFVRTLQNDRQVLGIILFGSWARGNHRPESDVDLLVIRIDGFTRRVEQHDDQFFEITYTTEQGAITFWQANPDDAVELWRVAQVLFDRDGTVARLKAVGDAIEKQGKPPLSADQYAHMQFDSFDEIRAAEAMAADDPTTAKMLLALKVLQLSERFFDVRQLWTPPPKLRLPQIQQHHPALYKLIVASFDTASVSEQIRLAKQITEVGLNIPSHST